MPSRMEKYYQINNEEQKRSKKNQNLYNTIYEDVSYDFHKEEKSPIKIDIEALNHMLERPAKEKQREIKQEVSFLDDDKNYDINEVLNVAKEKREPEIEDYHKLSLKQIELLKKIASYKSTHTEETEEIDKLLHTMSNTKMLKNLTDKDLSLNLLDDLTEDPKKDIDKSFYTTNAKFKAEDFEQLNGLKEDIKKNNKLIKVLVYSLISIVIVTLVLLIIFL
jgi:hypothetical protein